MFKELHISYLEWRELITTAARIKDIASSAAKKDDFIDKIITLLSGELENLENSVRKIKKNKFTSLLKKQDDLRDDLFVALRNFVNSNRRRKSPEIRDAAEALVMIFKKNGWALHRFNYTKQSAQLSVLFADLSDSAAVENLARIGAGSWLSELKEAQADFEKMYTQKVEEETGKEYITVRDSAKLVGDDLITLLKCLAVEERVTPGAITKEVEKINEVIEDIMTTVKARRTREDNEKEKEQGE